MSNQNWTGQEGAVCKFHFDRRTSWTSQTFIGTPNNVDRWPAATEVIDYSNYATLSISRSKWFGFPIRVFVWNPLIIVTIKYVVFPPLLNNDDMSNGINFLDRSAKLLGGKSDRLPLQLLRLMVVIRVRQPILTNLVSGVWPEKRVRWPLAGLFASSLRMSERAETRHVRSRHTAKK